MEKYQNVIIPSRTGLWDMVDRRAIGPLVFGAFEHNTLGDETDLIVCMLLSSGQWLEINTLFDTIENVLAETIENILYEHSLV